MADAVHQPKHYTSGGIECIEAIRAALGAAEFRAYCIGNVLKYCWRYKHKNGSEDLRKAAVYLGWAQQGMAAPEVDMTKPGPPIDPPETPSVRLYAEAQAQRDGHTADGGGIIPHGIAEAMIRAKFPVDPERDDDEGEPMDRYAGAACNIGGRCDE